DFVENAPAPALRGLVGDADAKAVPGEGDPLLRRDGPAAGVGSSALLGLLLGLMLGLLWDPGDRARVFPGLGGRRTHRIIAITVGVAGVHRGGHGGRNHNRGRGSGAGLGMLVFLFLSLFGSPSLNWSWSMSM